MSNDDRLKRDRERIDYIEGISNKFESEGPEKFVENVIPRILSAANDIYGVDSNAAQFMRNIYLGLEVEPEEFGQNFELDEANFVEKKHAKHLGTCLAYSLLALKRGQTNFLEENDFYSFWESLENAGMSHEDIGRYFERFEDEAVP